MKIPEPVKLASGTWFIRLRLGGESIPISALTRTACIQQAQLAKAEYAAGKHRKRYGDVTLGECLDAYIKRYDPVLSPSTAANYRSMRKARFKDYMDIPVREIRDWQGMVNKELASVSEKTVRNAWGLVSAALRDSGQPVPQVKMPRIPVNEMPYLEPEEIPLFLAAIEGDPAEIEILLELHSLRRSEMMAVVQNSRIDLKRNLITVAGAIVPGRDNKLVAKKTNKSRASTREIPIMIPRLAALVKPYLDAGEPIPVHGNTMILRHVHDACRRAGVTDVTNHGLRHTFAVLGYSVGIPERALMELGGWDDPDTMHKIDIRVAQRDRERAKNKMAEFYSSPVQTKEERYRKALEDLAQLRASCSDLEDLQPVFSALESLPDPDGVLKNVNENVSNVQNSA